jgi:hypothetical protein
MLPSEEAPSGDTEGTGGIRRDAGRERVERHLNGAGKAVDGVHGDIEGRTRRTLDDGDRV